MRRLVRLFALLAVTGACWPVASASALSYPVTSTADTKAKGTLRASIEEANAHSGADSIPIEVTGTIELATALPTVGDDVAIAGPGAGSLTIARGKSAPPFRVLEFNGAASTLSGVTVSGGLDFLGGGAGVFNSSGDLTLVRVVVTGNEALSEGAGTNIATAGGIFSRGSLTVRESLISGNTATAAGGDENVAAGGGIEVEGALFLERSTVSGNLARALAEGGKSSQAVGGGIALASGGAIIEESTISGNVVVSAEAAEASLARGGGIQANSLTLIRGSTITGNSAEDSGSAAPTVVGDNVATSSGQIRNSIVSDPRGEGENCAGGLYSGGFNLDEDGSCKLGKASDLTGVVAGVDPVLKNNGGPTPTHALLENSPALDRGNSFGIAVDQRGLARPVDLASVANAAGGDGSDIGAFELQPPLLPPVLVTPVASDRQTPNTRIVSGPPRATYKRLAKFRFASSEAQSTFQCKLDGKPWRGCRNPYKRKVSAGRKHVFRVRAIDRFGNVDPTPARFGWRVKKIVG